MGEGTSPLRCWAGNPIGRTGHAVSIWSKIPVSVQGGHVTVGIAGGLKGLAIQLADEEVRLRTVGTL